MSARLDSILEDVDVDRLRRLRSTLCDVSASDLRCPLDVENKLWLLTLIGTLSVVIDKRERDAANVQKANT